MIKESISKLIDKQDLTRQEMEAVMNEIMTGVATAAQIGAFLTALRLKGETVEEITGAAIVMREKAAKIDLKAENKIIIDTCGTGGSGTNAFNISTTCAFVAAGAGIVVAKHGNKSVSSQCGSADVLQALGININLTPEEVGECISQTGIGFLYAPLFHSAMKYAIGPRREIGIRTIFNVLGPLTNPAGANRQVLGVYDEKLCEALAGVLKNLGSKHAFVVHGLDGLDEITTTNSTKITELKNNEIKVYHIKPEDFGIKPAKAQDLRGGGVQENAEIILNILKGAKGAKRDIVLLNTAAAFVAADKAENLKEGLKIAAQSIDTGKALEKLEALRKASNK
ncbi:MAG: anthranilate phosphoribosyltransferase [Candidatus Omnitrophota bacterium]